MSYGEGPSIRISPESCADNGNIMGEALTRESVRDKRVIRHVRKWLSAGVMENGMWHKTDEGTPQGGSISPLLANIYLHYFFDLWANSWRNRKSVGDIVMVRYADDIVLGFQYKHEAVGFLEELKERFKKFNLELHTEKTTLIEFGRYAMERKRRGETRHF